MRLPVIPNLSTKDGLANKNARLTNVLAEKNKAQIRPGLSQVFDYAGVGAGLIPWNRDLIILFGDTIYTDYAGWNLGSGSYAAGTTYAIGDSVWSGGNLWTSLTAGNIGNTPPAATSTVSTYWTPSYPPAWVTTYTYRTGTRVSKDGYIWISLVDDNIGHTPEEGAYWTSPNPPVSYTHTLTAGFSDSGAGSTAYGFGTLFGNPVGSIVPGTLSGSSINSLSSQYGLGGTLTSFSLSASVAQGYFTSITANSITVTSASASYSSFGGITLWSWSGISMFTATTTYPVTIV